MPGVANDRSETMDERQARHFLAEPMTEPGSEDRAGCKEKIRQLELEARPLDPGPKDRLLLRDKVVAYADDFLEGIDGKPTFVGSEGEDSALYDSPISEESTDPDEVLDLLDHGVIRRGVNVGSAGHLAYIPGSNLYTSALADYLATVTNRYSGLYFASPGAVRMERMLLRWMADFLGYPAASAGDLTSGGSIANLVGIVTAREAHDLKARDFGRAVVYLSAQSHHAIDKALRIAGLEESVKRFVPLDGRHHMRPEALENAVVGDAKAGLRPWLIAATAGTTDAGAVDPLDDLADIACRHGLWLHVDGAYGAPFALTEQGKRILGGIERSDSVVLDPHKGLFLPFGSGAVLVREGRHLLAAHHYDASYLQDTSALASGDEVSPADLSPELTRPFRALRLWLPLKLAGGCTVPRRTGGETAPRAALTRKDAPRRWLRGRTSPGSLDRDAPLPPQAGRCGRLQPKAHQRRPTGRPGVPLLNEDRRKIHPAYCRIEPAHPPGHDRAGHRDPARKSKAARARQLTECGLQRGSRILCKHFSTRQPCLKIAREIAPPPCYHQPVWQATPQDGCRLGKHTIGEAFAVAPRELRRVRGQREEKVRGEIQLRLPFKTPFDAKGMLRFLGTRAVAGVETFDGETYRRTLRLPHGAGMVALSDGGDYVLCVLRLENLRDLDAAVQRCRWLLDLDADPVAVADALGAGPLLGDLVRSSPGRRVPGSTDGAELAFRAVLGQQISVAGACTLAGRLVARCGEPLPETLAAGGDEPTHLFPGPHAVAEAAHRDLGVSTARRQSLRALARTLADGGISFDLLALRAGVERRLLELRGIGPWTASYVAMRALRNPDAFLPTDLRVRRAILRLGHADDRQSVAALAESWRPWRAYATQHLWASLGDERDQTKKREVVA